MTAHHTNLFEGRKLILRRAQPFFITLTLNRPLQKEENILFICETGPVPTEASKTRTTFPLFGAKDQDTWSAVLTSSESSSLTVTINSPPSAMIGNYVLSVVISSSSRPGNPTTRKLGGLVLLFNPWMNGDDVFMAEEDLRQEYVLNENGVIFVGNEDDIMKKDWEYNQFGKDVLELCLEILDRSMNYQKDPMLDVSQRNDPLYVCRVLSATLNSKDENGVLVENWSGEYGDGKNPSSWNGSFSILKEWYFKGYKPVKYGQCWVYGGLLCTVLRCLGIPTRVISNFNSSQDRNGNLFIDLRYDSQGSRYEFHHDLLWNFHVWNEAWFRRKDLGPSYSGWQVMDSTPLETSDGMYRCGPAPLVAIKEGDVMLNYDVGFMFASVNADLAYWIEFEDGTKKRTSNDTRSIGKFISTKAVGSDERVDVTNMYKYPEGSQKEREVFEKAVKALYEGRLASEKNLLHVQRRSGEKLQPGNILFASFTMENTPTIGQDLNLILTLKNLSPNTIKIPINMTSSTVLYTGRHRNNIWSDARSASLSPNEEKQISIQITYSQYGKHLGEDNVIRLTALCVVDGTEERILMEKDVTLVNPPISIKIPDQVVRNKSFTARIIITNTLSETMNSGSLQMEGYGLIDGVLKTGSLARQPASSTYSPFSSMGTPQLDYVTQGLPSPWYSPLAYTLATGPIKSWMST
ncbi:protein-glutamine gamma-glutamyltransferase E-like [Rhinophrynus dorsalis]